MGAWSPAGFSARPTSTLRFAPPTVWIGLLRSPDFDRTDLSSLRKAYYGASAMPVEVLKEIWGASPTCGCGTSTDRPRSHPWSRSSSPRSRSRTQGPQAPRGQRRDPRAGPGGSARRDRAPQPVVVPCGCGTDPRRGRRPGALAPGGFKTPRVVHVVDQLPKNPSGKILKRELRDRFAAPAGPG